MQRSCEEEFWREENENNLEMQFCSSLPYLSVKGEERVLV